LVLFIIDILLMENMRKKWI